MDGFFEFLMYFVENFLAVFLMIGLLVIFRRSARLELDKRKNIVITIGCISALLILEVFETYCSHYPDLRVFRLIASVVGYWVRPMISFGFLSLITDLKKKSILIWVPAIINFLVFSTAFFSEMAFRFDEEYVFRRGPLGYTVFIVSYFYIVLVVVETVKNFRSGQKWRGTIVLVCAIGCAIAPVLEATALAQYILYPTMLISILLYYLYLYSELLARDVLTGLWKRDIFYQDVNRIGSRVTGVIVADMNGLKTLNDTQGHKAGDDALVSVSKEIRKQESDRIWAYRMGGDEFAILCLEKSEQDIIDLIALLKEKTLELGLSLSAGYSIRKEGLGVDALLIEADGRMYSDKHEYYVKNHLDRRKT